MGQGQKARAGATGSIERSPYRGLAWYDTEPDQIAVFAGRKADVLACSDKLFESTVLVLHGRTGCGKSSFLRAGLQPYLSGTSLTTQTAQSGADGAQKALQIWRMGQFPMRKLAEAFYAFASGLDGAEKGIASARPRAPATRSLQGLGAEEFVRACDDNPMLLLRAILQLEDDRDDLKPVLVLDQAEEMWTLSRQSLEGHAVSPDNSAGADLQSRKERLKFFQFLREMCSRTSQTRIILSMRTEYKGQFDDELQAVCGTAGLVGASGYYLEELQHADLVEAILCPTSENKKPGTGQSLRSIYKFSYKDGAETGGVADQIARALRDDESGTPPGGILPVLQVTCLRLYEMVRASAKPEEHCEITILDFKRLGAIHKQIDYYVQDRLEEAIRSTKIEALEVADEAERWYRLLTKQLVNVESDGRVTTRKVSLARLVEKGLNAGLRAFSMVDKKGKRPDGEAPRAAGAVLKHLRDSSILRSEAVAKIGANVSSGGNSPEGTEDSVWSLGHDSVGLALNRWNQVYGQQFQHTSKMDMATAKLPERFKQADLFPFEKPKEFRFLTARDNIWDHMLLQYAVAHGFDRRLGLNIEPATELDLRVPGVSLKTLDAGMRQINASRECENYIIAWPRADFPNDGLADQWIDILITNASQGYGLICPVKFSETVSTFAHLHDEQKNLGLTSAASDNARRAAIVSGIKESMRRVVEFVLNPQNEESTIWVFDQPARDFVELVIDLLDGEPNLFDPASDARNAEAKASFLESRVRFLTSDDFDEQDQGVRDPLFSRLLQYPNDFIVGSAFSRALALTTNHKSLIDVQHLPELIQLIWPYEHHKKRYNELIDRYQTTQSHTTWQINFPQTEMDDERLDPIVYRIAALGFYTAEHVRTNMDSFVRYVYGELQNNADVGTFRLDRDAIRTAVKDCYVFLPFDQYAQQFLDWKSPRSYQLKPSDRAEHEQSGIGDLNELSRVRRIYSRMIEFRHAFLNDFQLFNEQFIRLLDDEQEENLDEKLKRADRLRESAWNNYRVYNFYDAAAQIREGRDELRRVQTSFEHWRRG